MSAKPLANNNTVSLVDVSPSTEIILNVSLMSPLNASYNIDFEIFTSVIIKPNIVHILGWIIPEPLHIPPIVHVFPPISNSKAISFGIVSVVIMASAAKWPPSKLSSNVGASNWIPFVILSIGSWAPITPVEATSTCLFSISNALAVASAICSQ